PSSVRAHDGLMTCHCADAKRDAIGACRSMASNPLPRKEKGVRTRGREAAAAVRLRVDDHRSQCPKGERATTHRSTQRGACGPPVGAYCATHKPGTGGGP